jgi:hypothetical protein
LGVATWRVSQRREDESLIGAPDLLAMFSENAFPILQVELRLFDEATRRALPTFNVAQHGEETRASLSS